MNAGGFALLFGLSACGAAEAGTTPLKGPDTVDLLQWIVGLTIVLVALLVFAGLLRRLGSFSRVESGQFKVLAALSLGARERVVLVQVGSKQLVLGVSAGSVRALCVLEGADTIGVPERKDLRESFSVQLATILSRKQ